MNEAAADAAKIKEAKMAKKSELNIIVEQLRAKRDEAQRVLNIVEGLRAQEPAPRAPRKPRAPRATITEGGQA